MKHVVDMYTAKIQSRRKYTYEKTDNIDYTCNDTCRL